MRFQKKSMISISLQLLWGLSKECGITIEGKKSLCVSKARLSDDQTIIDHIPSKIAFQLTMDCPRDRDILCGDTLALVNHLGNRRFRKLVDFHIEDFLQDTSRGELLVKSILIALNGAGYRFLKLNKSSKVFEMIQPLDVLRMVRSTLSHRLGYFIQHKNLGLKSRHQLKVESINLMTYVESVTERHPQDDWPPQKRMKELLMNCHSMSDMLLDSSNVTSPPTTTLPDNLTLGVSDTAKDMGGDATSRLSSDSNVDSRTTLQQTSATATATAAVTIAAKEADPPMGNSNPLGDMEMNTTAGFTARDVLFHQTLPDFYASHSGNQSLQRLINSFRRNFHAAVSDKSKQKILDKIISTLQNGSYRFVVISELGEHEVLEKLDIANKVRDMLNQRGDGIRQQDVIPNELPNSSKPCTIDLTAVPQEPPRKKSRFVVPINDIVVPAMKNGMLPLKGFWKFYPVAELGNKIDLGTIPSGWKLRLEPLTSDAEAITLDVPSLDQLSS